MTTSGGGVVLLCGPGESSNAVYNYLNSYIPIAQVIQEEQVSRRALLRGRLRRLGGTTVAGQLLFQAGMMPLLQRQGRRRLEEIRRTGGLDVQPIPPAVVRRVRSANSPEAIDLLRPLRPAVVVVNGTRILSAQVLRSVPAPFVNMHAGITPYYRGVHGGYWALADGHPERCGVTVHLIDTGVDTGSILGQARIHPTPADSFVTYPMLQLAAGLPILRSAVGQAMKGTLHPIASSSAESKQWYHPTAWGYLQRRCLHGVR